MLKLYGTSKSRSARSLWAVEELGLKYEHIPTAVPQAKSSDHLRINANGHLPAIDDDGSIIWESMAINLYLAEKYGKGSLWPASVEDHGHAYKWSFFGMTEMESHRTCFPPRRPPSGFPASTSRRCGFRFHSL